MCNFKDEKALKGQLALTKNNINCCIQFKLIFLQFNVNLIFSSSINEKNQIHCNQW